MEEKFPIVFSTLERFRIKTNLINNSAIELQLCTEQSWRLEEAAEVLRGEGFDTEILAEVELLTIHNYDEATLAKLDDPSRIIVRQTNPKTIRIIRSKE